MSINKKSILSFTLLILIPLLFFGFSGLFSAMQNARRDFENNTKEVLEYAPKNTNIPILTSPDKTQKVMEVVTNFSNSFKDHNESEVLDLLTDTARDKYKDIVGREINNISKFNQRLITMYEDGDNIYLTVKIDLSKKMQSFSNYPIRYKLILANDKYKIDETNLFKNIDWYNIQKFRNPLFVINPDFKAYLIPYILWVVSCLSAQYFYKKTRKVKHL